MMVRALHGLLSPEFMNRLLNVNSSRKLKKLCKMKETAATPLVLQIPAEILSSFLLLPSWRIIVEAPGLKSTVWWTAV